MKFLQNIIHSVKPNFEEGGKLHKYYYVFEAFETLAFQPETTTGHKGAHIRDANDTKRMMSMVIFAMVPCLLFGIYNAGYQHFIATGQEADLIPMLITGTILVLPIIVVSYGVGLGIEFTFATIRRHPVNEGFLVSGMLIPLIVPTTIPLWQVALATAFGVIIAKEVFGGTGMNIFNVALTTRAFLYFAYPSQISGEVWTYLGDKTTVDGYSGATPLAVAYEASSKGTQSVTAALSETNTVLQSDFYSFYNMFMGFIPGSIGETSTLMALIGAVILIITGVGSWKIIVSVFAGALAMGLGFNAVGVNEYMLIPAHYHLVMGGLAFGAVFMATDPVTASQTELGKWIYGFLIGVLTVIIRVVNPAYPEGIMLAILFMNVFAPLIDFYIVKANKTRRLSRVTV
ncbi:MAG: NADH:ubiquinone reductase (Na(+)-transporting) subunit B [Cyclobacteriaceae bacterium]|nr:NADH:ubiquinone reductase (Na(+)-transporting) subunit B [Cyclobacteriaceae bacterium]